MCLVDNFGNVCSIYGIQFQGTLLLKASASIVPIELEDFTAIKHLRDKVISMKGLEQIIFRKLAKSLATKVPLLPLGSFSLSALNSCVCYSVLILGGWFNNIQKKVIHLPLLFLLLLSVTLNNQLSPFL